MDSTFSHSGLFGSILSLPERSIWYFKATLEDYASCLWWNISWTKIFLCLEDQTHTLNEENNSQGPPCSRVHFCGFQLSIVSHLSTDQVWTPFCLIGTLWLMCSSGCRQLSCWLHLTNISPDISFHLPPIFCPYRPHGYSFWGRGLLWLGCIDGTSGPAEQNILLGVFFFPQEGKRHERWGQEREGKSQIKDMVGLHRDPLSHYSLFLTEALTRHRMSPVAVCPFNACVTQAWCSFIRWLLTNWVLLSFCFLADNSYFISIRLCFCKAICCQLKA